jgi:hypothetical protein
MCDITEGQPGEDFAHPCIEWVPGHVGQPKDIGYGCQFVAVWAEIREAWGNGYRIEKECDACEEKR